MIWVRAYSHSNESYQLGPWRPGMTDPSPTLGSVFYHCPEPRSAAIAIHRILSKGGWGKKKLGRHGVRVHFWREDYKPTWESGELVVAIFKRWIVDSWIAEGNLLAPKIRLFTVGDHRPFDLGLDWPISADTPIPDLESQLELYAAAFGL